MALMLAPLILTAIPGMPGRLETTVMGLILLWTGLECSRWVGGLGFFERLGRRSDASPTLACIIAARRFSRAIPGRLSFDALRAAV